MHQHSDALSLELARKAQELRIDVLKMVFRAQSGHLGGPYSAAEIVSSLFFHQLNLDPERPDWPDRDRFILSKGHAAPILYAALAYRGFIPMNELETFRRLGTRLEGHPDRKLPGVEAVAGPLGHGVAIGAGMAWALSRSSPKPSAASAPRLEMRAVVGGPYKNEQEALASQGGTIPADEQILHGFSAVTNDPGADSVYVLKQEPIITGKDFRAVDPSTNSYSGQREVLFTLTNVAGDRFYKYTSMNIDHSMAVVMNDRVREVVVITNAIRDRGIITGSFTQDEVMALSMMLRADAQGKHRADNY